MNNILLKSETQCTGCGVCNTICPKNAVKIIIDDCGFYKAVVDDGLCVGCGLCKRVCFKFIKENGDKGYDIKESNVYAAYSKDNKLRSESSSGGIGSEIAKYGIKNNYSVCGVIYDYKLNRAKHVVVDKEKDLKLIQGSKYIQSYTPNGFTTLKSEEKYIIIGSPCQIYGLRKYMEIKKIKNWILVDFFCHGIPSYKAWDKYIDYIQKKYKTDNIVSINFRDKSKGWHSFSMQLLANGKVYSKTLNKDLFLKIFLSNLCLNEPCFKCPLRFNRLYSDIRLGDFWGKKFGKNTEGVSIVLTNNIVGDNLFKNLKEKIYLEDCDYDELYKSQYVKELNRPKEHDGFIDDLKKDETMSNIYFKYLFLTDIKNVIFRTLNIPKRVMLKLLPKKIKSFLKSSLNKN